MPLPRGGVPTNPTVTAGRVCLRRTVALRVATRVGALKCQTRSTLTHTGH